MELKDILPQKYAELGFEIIKSGEKSLILKYKDKTIFVFSSGISLTHDFIPKLCDYYLKSCISNGGKISHIKSSLHVAKLPDTERLSAVRTSKGIK